MFLFQELSWNGSMELMDVILTNFIVNFHNAVRRIQSSLFTGSCLALLQSLFLYLNNHRLSFVPTSMIYARCGRRLICPCMTNLWVTWTVWGSALFVNVKGPCLIIIDNKGT